MMEHVMVQELARARHAERMRTTQPQGLRRSARLIQLQIRASRRHRG